MQYYIANFIEEYLQIFSYEPEPMSCHTKNNRNQFFSYVKITSKNIYL